MKLCWRTHKTLEEFCKTVCTGNLGWNRQRRKDCRNNTMCQECKRRIDTATTTKVHALDKARLGERDFQEGNQ